MKLSILLALFFFTAVIIPAQKKKKKKNDKTEVKEVIYILDDEETIEIPSENYSFSSQENETHIIKGYYLTKTKTGNYSYNYGIRKGSSIILPQIFSYATVKEGKVKLTLASKSGIYNPLTENWDIPLEYEGLSSLKNENYLVSKNNKKGVIDLNNNIIIPLEWEAMDILYSMPNYYIVKQEGKQGVINIITGKLVIPCKYDRVKLLQSQSLFKVVNSGKINLLNIHNELLLKNWYEKIESSKRLGYFVVSKNGKMGVIDESENIIVPINKEFLNTEPFSDGSYLVKNELGKYGFMLIDGTVTLPFKYDNLRSKYVSRYTKSVLVGQSEKCGIIKVNAGVPYELTTCDYDDVQVSNTLYIVKKEGKYGIIDSYAKEVLSMKYNSIKTIGNKYEERPLFKAQKGDVYYLVLQIGKLASKEEYYSLENLPIYKASYTPTNYYIFSNKKGGFGLIDKLGMEMLAPEYEQIIMQIANSIIAKKNGKYGVYSLSKRSKVIDFKYDLLIYNNDKYYGIIGNKYFEISKRGLEKPLN